MELILYLRENSQCNYNKAFHCDLLLNVNWSWVSSDSTNSSFTRNNVSQVLRHYLHIIWNGITTHKQDKCLLNQTIIYIYIFKCKLYGNFKAVSCISTKT